MNQGEFFSFVIHVLEELNISDMIAGSIRIKFNATIGFSESLGIGFNLLGRVDFFDRFRICFTDKEKIVEMTFL